MNEQDAEQVAGHEWLVGILETLPSERRRLEEQLAAMNAVNEQLRAKIDVMTKGRERMSYDLRAARAEVLRLQDAAGQLAAERAEVARLNERLAKSVDQFKQLRAERDAVRHFFDEETAARDKALAERDAAREAGKVALAARDRALDRLTEVMSERFVADLDAAAAAEAAAAAAAEPVDIVGIMRTPGA